MLKEVNWDEFEFRCHYLGELMTKTKGKTNLQKFGEAEARYIKLDKRVDKMEWSPAKDVLIEKLFKLNDEVEKLKDMIDKPTFSQTCLNRLSQIYTEETTGRKKDIKNMYIEKGLMTEEDSITLYSLKSGLYYKKNKVRLGNGFINGEWDFEDEENEMTIDTKSSFDIFTFDSTVAKGLNPMYDWQGQGYMWLRDRKKHRIAYCLNNTPKKILNQLERQLKWNFDGTQDELEEAYALLRDNHTYDDLPLDRKIRVYDVNRDEEKIEALKSSIPHFRNYLKNFESNKTQVYANYEDSESSISEESTYNS